MRPGRLRPLHRHAAHRDPATGQPVHRAINACLAAALRLDGMMVTTTEGIGSVPKGSTRPSTASRTNNGTQCGFCTPGFVMTPRTPSYNRTGNPPTGDRELLWRQPLSLHRLPADPTWRSDPGLRLRCRRGPDTEMPDGSFLPCPRGPGQLARIHLEQLPPPGTGTGRSISQWHGREWYRPAASPKSSLSRENWWR